MSSRRRFNQVPMIPKKRKCKGVTARDSLVRDRKHLTQHWTPRSAHLLTHKTSNFHPQVPDLVLLATQQRRICYIRRWWTPQPPRNLNLRFSAECFHLHILLVIAVRTTNGLACSIRQQHLGEFTTITSRSQFRPLVPMKHSFCGKWNLALPITYCSRNKTTWTTLTSFSQHHLRQTQSSLNRTELLLQSEAKHYVSEQQIKDVLTVKILQAFRPTSSARLTQDQTRWLKLSRKNSSAMQALSRIVVLIMTSKNSSPPPNLMIRRRVKMSYLVPC